MSKSVRSFDEINIPAPCDADWESMIGNDQVRFCEHCHLHVNNLSAMTRGEAIRFVARSRGRICIRYIQGHAGGPLTGKMPEKLYNIGRRTSRIAAGAFSAALSITTAAAQSCPSTAPPAASSAQQSVEVADLAPVFDEFTSVVAGTIANSGKVPVAGVTVALVDRDSGEERYTTTSANGDYSFQNLPAGDYLICARKPRFVSASDKANLHAGSRVRIDFEMNEATRVAVMGGAMIARAVEETPLVKAISENDLATVKALAFTTPTLNAIQTAEGVGLLAEAVARGNREIVEVLLLAGANVNGRTRDGRTPLMSISDKTSVDLLRDLLSYGANVNARDDYGDNAIIVAAGLPNLGLLKELMSAGARIDAMNSVGQNALFVAARNNVEAVDLLIKSGADLNVRDEDGQTALMAMASYGDVALFQALANKGANVDLADYEGRTTLMLAASNEDPAIAELMIRMGANIDVQATDGTTALMVAAEAERDKTLALLIAAGANLNATDAQGQTVLARVAMTGSEEMTQALLDAGADFKIKDKEGNTPLAIARERENEEIVKLLKSRGARE
jgi:ankyrin repeat protein